MRAKIFRWSLLITTLLILQACTSTKPISKKDQWSFELEKGGCMDVCQAYSILVKNNGEYAYTGRFKVKHLGKKNGNIDAQKMAEFKKLIADIDWKSLQSAYDQPGQGSQSKQMKYQSESVLKTITYSQFEPQELRHLENFINTLIDQDDF